MALPIRFSLAVALGASLLAQEAAPAPALPMLKWRGSIWASAVTPNRESADGSLVFRPI